MDQNDARSFERTKQTNRMRRVFTALIKWDSVVCVSIFRMSGKRYLDRFMFGVSHFGYGYAYPLIFLFIVVFDTGTRMIIPAGCLSFVIEHTTHKLLKKTTKRSRPFETLPQIRSLMRPLDAFSFPSGHAASAFVMATLLQHLYPFLVVPLYLCASIIAISRIYNGLHYPSDIMAGSVIGLFSARIGLIIFL